MRKVNKLGMLILGLSLIVLLSACSLYGPAEEATEVDPPPVTLESEDITSGTSDSSATNSEAGVNDDATVESVEMTKQTIYFFDYSGDVVPLTLDIPKVEWIGKEVLQYMTVGGPAEDLLPPGFRPVLPEGTSFSLNVKADQKLAIIDFSKEFLNYEAKSAADEKKILDAIIWSMSEFSTVEKVEIRVNGYLLETMPQWDTPVIEPLSRVDGINIELANNINISNTTPVTLYFSKSYEGFNYLVPVTRLIQKTDNIAKATLEQLIIGPKTGSELVSPILPTTKLLSVKVSDNLVVADFDEEILGINELLTMEQVDMIVWSLIENTHTPTIQIKIKGDTDVLPANLTEPIIAPELINYTIF